jgi:hypothetical protein
MFTRKDYMNNICTHEEFYAQFINSSVKSYVEDVIGLNQILKSTDEHLNDIPLVLWDRAHGILDNKTLKSANCCQSFSNTVCTLKTYAKQLRGTK